MLAIAFLDGLGSFAAASARRKTRKGSVVWTGSVLVRQIIEADYFNARAGLYSGIVGNEIGADIGLSNDLLYATTFF